MQAQQCVHESADTLLNLQNIRSQYLAVLQNSAQLQDDFLEKLEQLLQKLCQSISNTQWVIIQCVESFGREQQNAIISGILNLNTLDYIEQCNTNMLQFHLLVADDLKMVCGLFLGNFCSHSGIELTLSIVFIARIGSVEYDRQDEAKQSAQWSKQANASFTPTCTSCRRAAVQ